jgi:glycosyltransferase involved in cell wall biosynthesis
LQPDRPLLLLTFKFNNMKRVLLISNEVFHYRVSNYNYFARRFREEGWQLYVRANELQKQNPFPLEFDFASIPFRFMLYKREIERLRPDVVILFLHLKDLFIWPLIHWLRFKRISFVYWNKGVNLEVRNPGIRNLPFYYIHSLANAIVLYSKNEIKDIRPKNRGKVFVANNTVNFESFPVISSSKEELKRELGIKFEKVVLFVGRMRSVKKVEHLIQVFNDLQMPGVGCVIVGETMGYDLSRMIKRENVLYLGEIHDPNNVGISKLFKLSDIFCIPGDVGLGLNQAFYWGLPVVTENGLQPPEIHYLRNGENGFIVPENDVSALNNRLLELLENNSLRSKFSTNARNTIMTEGSIETMFNGFLNCLRFLCPTTTSKGTV